VAGAGLLLFQMTGTAAEYLPEVFPALLLFSLGLSMTVAPLTAAVLAGMETQAGIASGVNNAVARVAGLLGTASVGAAVSASFVATFTTHLGSAPLTHAGRTAVTEAKRLALGKPSVSGVPPHEGHAITAAAEAASLHAFHSGMAIAAVLVALGGVVGFAFIRNPRRATSDVKAGDCGGGQLVGSPNVPEGAAAQTG
jgi:hypothetical protein